MHAIAFRQQLPKNSTKMNEVSMKLAERLVPATYMHQAAEAKATREKRIRVLIEQVRLKGKCILRLRLNPYKAPVAICDFLLCMNLYIWLILMSFQYFLVLGALLGRSCI